MEVAVVPSPSLSFPSNSKTSSRNIVVLPEYSRSTVLNIRSIRKRRSTRRINEAVNDVSAAAELGQVSITWQIVVGAIAGVTPFVVAGIEFSKRIIAQRRCEECGGSGLVLVENEYCRCPECGGFLPWQSWRRFFSG